MFNKQKNISQLCHFEGTYPHLTNSGTNRLANMLKSSCNDAKRNFVNVKGIRYHCGRLNSQPT